MQTRTRTAKVVKAAKTEQTEQPSNNKRKATPKEETVPKQKKVKVEAIKEEKTKAPVKAAPTKAAPKQKKAKAEPVEELAEDEPENAAEGDDTVDEWGIEQMDLPAIKGLLRERQLSVKGDKKVLTKRLIGRMHKEKNPTYKAKPVGRHCKWCGALMKKRRSFNKQFYGCSTWPACQYTTSLSGYAKPGREHLRGKPGQMHGRDYRYYERLYGY